MSVDSILVVDDDPQIRRVLRTTLREHGYEPIEARNGKDAIAKFRDEKPSLIVLDVNMPGMNGFETCRTIRSTSNVPIIMLTVRDSETDTIAALDAGADDYVTKPFSFPVLLARIRAAIRRAMNFSSGMPVVRFDNVEINFNLRRVFVGDREARLTPKEFDLLQYMVSHANVPIPHGELLQSIWGDEESGDLEHLRVFINQLRKKLEENPSDPKYLLTEPWIGYRLRLPV
jgi:two-component system KDP operon response regulator KdpE